VNVIESDEGFSVEVLGRTGLKYTEGDDEFFVDSEVLQGPAALAVFSWTVAGWADKQPVEAARRMRIIENIRRAFQFRGIEIEVK
jgi:hypothetical protein